MLRLCQARLEACNPEKFKWLEPWKTQIADSLKKLNVANEEVLKVLQGGGDSDQEVVKEAYNFRFLFYLLHV